jgi:penicillin-binding protein 1A
MEFLREQIIRARDKWREIQQTHPRECRAVVRTSAAIALLLTITFTWFLLSLSRTLPDRDAITRIGVMDQATTIYDATDTLAFTIYKEQRIEVPLDRISPHLLDAVLAIEDQRFYDHHGFDLIRIGSAALANMRHGRAAEGASTITQQLARISFLTPAKTMRRKLQELILAGRIEHMFSKPKILEIYLNKVYFGDGLYGIEAASRGFFGKHASDLTVAEAAMLGGVIKSPSNYAPTISAERALTRRNVVLQAMLDNAVIDRTAWDQARRERLRLRDTLRADEPYGQYFKEEVRRELVDRFGWQLVYQGGLRVFSTVDRSMQRAAEAAVADRLKAITVRQKALAAKHSRRASEDTDPLQAALVAMDPHSGHVRAMIGGRNFKESPFNRAVQAKRQPGSAFKPFVYAAALEAGYTPSTVIQNLNAPIDTVQGAWTPEDEHSTATSMTLRTGLRTSSNRAAVQLLQQVGIPTTVNYARTMGVGNLPSVPSLALGSGEVTLQSMTAAYAAFANRGRVPRPVLIRRVEDRDGRVIYTAQETSTAAISESTAFLMTTMLADVVNAGTAAGARQLGFTLPAAGKTGTTNDFKDAWFIGFTPSLIAGVWVGFDHPRTILPRGFASDIAVPMWASFMKAATRDAKPEPFKPPTGISVATICRLSGKLATPDCIDGVYTEYFSRGTQPMSYCDLHEPDRGFFSSVASLFTDDHPTEHPTKRIEDGAAPPAVATAGIVPPPVTAATAGLAIPPPPAAVAGQEPAGSKKKRGFWSKMFGIGKDKDDQ